MAETPTLRDGDRVCGAGTVRDGRIVWEDETVTVEAPALAVGDRVSWHPKGATERDFGRVLAVDPEGDDPANSYVWIRQEGKWPRLTMLAKELRRHG
ncbi:hypothetical protein ABIE45_004583 [Methylobacterium sp. OAE515]|uniref:hypothetical protein n=1 Tax=Methylobacterium sp. OAE515 TaxID=2817895 RepID=UPI00178955CE